jgi:hypothetical protein
MVERPHHHYLFQESIRKTLTNYLTDFRLSTRDDSDYIKFVTFSSADQSKTVALTIEHEPSEGMVPMAKLTLIITDSPADQVIESLEPTNFPDEALKFLLISLCKAHVINPRMHSFFNSNRQFMNHYSIFALNRPKLSFSWFASDVICVINNKRPDVFGNKEPRLISMEQLNFEKVGKNPNRSSYDFERVFTNETLKLVHHLDVSECPGDSEEDYLSMMIQSQNKCEKYNAMNLKDAKVFRPVQRTQLLFDFLSQLLSATSNFASDNIQEFAPSVDFDLTQAG